MTGIATFCLVQIKIAEVVIPQRIRLVMKALSLYDNILHRNVFLKLTSFYSVKT